MTWEFIAVPPSNVIPMSSTMDLKSSRSVESSSAVLADQAFSNDPRPLSASFKLNLSPRGCCGIEAEQRGRCTATRSCTLNAVFGVMGSTSDRANFAGTRL